MSNHSHERAGRARLHTAPTGEAAVSAIVTSAKDSGGFEFPTSIFRLRDDIPAPGDYLLDAAISDVLADWGRQGDEGLVWGGTVLNYTSTLNGFARYAAYKGLALVSDLNAKTLTEWIAAPNKNGEPVSNQTYNERLTVARTFFRTLICLGITDKTPSFSVPRRKHSQRHVDPYTESEIQRLKDTAEPKRGEPVTKAAACLALALLGASSGEIGNVYQPSFWISSPGLTTFDVVKVQGGGDYFIPRWLPLDDAWAADILLRRISELEAEHPNDFWLHGVAYQPAPGNDNNFGNRAAATSTLLSRLIRDAGVNKGRSARVASITEYLAQRLYAETGSIETVAARLGMKKLDRAAHIVNPDWYATHAITPYLPFGDGGDE